MILLLGIILIMVILLLIIIQIETVMAKQEELVLEVQTLTAQVNKIGEETKTTLQKVKDLEAALANQENVSPELQAAFDALKASVQATDDLVADSVPVPPQE